MNVRHVIAGQEEESIEKVYKWCLLRGGVNDGGVCLYCNNELVFKAYGDGTYYTWDIDLQNMGLRKYHE